jgi:hypothetical protein
MSILEHKGCSIDSLIFASCNKSQDYIVAMKKIILSTLVLTNISCALHAQVMSNLNYIDKGSSHLSNNFPSRKNHLLKDTVISQSKKVLSDDDYEFGPEGGLVYQKGLYGQLGVAYSNNYNAHDVNVLIDVLKIDAQYNFSTTSPIFVPRITAELNLVTFTLRTSFEDFTNFTVNDYRFTPEIGITFLGQISLCFGWNIPLTDSRLGNIGAHVLSLTYTYNKGFIKDTF